MKGNINKLALMAVIAAVTLIPAVAFACDDDHPPKATILGEYYFTGGGPCLLGVGGFNVFLQPYSGKEGPWSMTDATWEGVYSFKPNGEGTFSAIYRVVDFPSLKWPPAPPGTPQQEYGSIPNAGAAKISWNFKYMISEKGRITFEYIPGSYLGEWTDGPQAGTQFFLNIKGPYYGVLSAGGKHIVVTWGVPLQLMVTLDPNHTIEMFPIICNAVQQGFRCHGKCPELVY